MNKMSSYYGVKTTALTIAISCFCLLLGCSVEPEEPVDNISGVYYLRGTQTHSGLPWFNRLIDYRDPYTNYTEFSFYVKLVKDKVDTVRIYGLEGADAGIAEKKVFPNCTNSDDCKVYGKRKSSGEIEIDIEHDGRRYQASGYITSLTARLSYGNVSVDYDLSGNPVDR
ncbi:hypothetical protein [Rhodohalobacter sp. 614A]|uniref:hypothetical protein n=1 Tax=Rhodohalobacter sp. 614A TaxID=2908649 RepID=UPI001F180502|nr:hypothetical protein [Rhodohalobacter sp. 614A]